MGNNFLRSRLFLAGIILATSCQALAQNVDVMSSQWAPGNIVIKKGTQHPKEILSWGTEAGVIPKDWKSISNEYFTISYPPCMAAHGTYEDYKTPEKSEGIDLDATKCPDFSKVAKENSFLSFEHNENYKSYFKAKVSSDPTLLSQSIKINGNEAKMFLELLNNDWKSQDSLLMKWEIITICKGNTMLITSIPVKGKEASEIIDKGVYTFPSLFQKIVGTFHCK